MAKNERIKNTTEDRSFAFAALDPYLLDEIPQPTEKQGARGYTTWGDDNRYPEYLLSLTTESATLNAVVNGMVDYIVGDDVVVNVPQFSRKMNNKGMTGKDVVEAMARAYCTYGGYALQILRARDGSISEIYPMDVRYIRTDKDCEKFYYSEAWKRMQGKCIIYPRFVPTFNEPSAVYYRKKVQSQTYPQPLYVAAIKAAEIERSIDDFHLSSINNGFMSSAIINFCNGRVSDEQKEEIVADFNEKFCGKNNAGRTMLSWCDSKENAVDVQQFDAPDFGERYSALEKNCRQKIATSFRANLNLFGVPTESNGFNSEEYKSAFELFNRTQIKPVQAMIVDSFDYIFGVEGSISITPFNSGM